jgi:hypothetical protein
MWKKIIAIGIIGVFIGLALSPTYAGATTVSKPEIVTIEYTTFDENNEMTTGIFQLTGEEFEQLKSILTELTEKVASLNDLDNIENIIKEVFGGKFQNLCFVLISSLKFGNIKNRAFITSSGEFYKLNPLKKSSISIHKKICFWRYTADGLPGGMTVILKPFALDYMILKGGQIGMMTRFLGFHITSCTKLPCKSYTFFMGTAKRAIGIDLPDIMMPYLP